MSNVALANAPATIRATGSGNIYIGAGMMGVAGEINSVLYR